MKTIAVYNSKGGVGKTATTVNLAYLSAQEGYNTLLWDLDSQGAASFYFRVKPKIKGGAEKLLTEKQEVSKHIKGTDYEFLDLLPADFSYRNLDLLLSDEKKPTKQLSKIIKTLDDEYDYLFIDCAPGISLTSEGIFNAADILLMPTIPTPLSLRTLDQVLKHFKKNELPLKQLVPFYSMVDIRRKMHRMIVDDSKKPIPFLRTTIPYLSDIERMGLARTPACLAPRSTASLIYRSLWSEVKSKTSEI